jgi:hypothetical protein
VIDRFDVLTMEPPRSLRVGGRQRTTRIAAPHPRSVKRLSTPATVDRLPRWSRAVAEGAGAVIAARLFVLLSMWPNV